MSAPGSSRLPPARLPPARLPPPPPAVPWRLRLSRRVDGSGVWIVVAVTTLAWLAMRAGWFGPSDIGDLPVYENAWRLMDLHQLPYRDFFLEYPPAAAALFWLVGVLPGSYATVFSVLMLICAAATATGVLACARALRRPPWECLAAALFAGTAPVLLGQLAQTRFDLLLSALLAWALWAALTERWTLGWVLLAVAVLFKIVPILLVPAFAIHQARRSSRRALRTGLARFAWTVVLPLVPLLVASPSGLWRLAAYHLQRPLQLESVWATPILAAWSLGLGGRPRIVESYGSSNLIGPHTVDLASAATAVGVAGLVAVAVIQWRRLARGGPPGPLLVSAVAADLAVIVACGKVFSPQYLLWALWVLPLVAGRFRLGPVALGAAAGLLTRGYFPTRFSEVGTNTGWPTQALIARNVAVAVLCAVVVRWLLVVRAERAPSRGWPAVAPRPAQGLAAAPPSPTDTS